METVGDPYANIRSDNSIVKSHVRFFNRMHRSIDIYWVDYQGRHVLYGTIAAVEYFDVRTFVTHPWVFRDSETGEKLVTLPDRAYVYYPKPNSFDDVARAIIIVSPLLPLKSLCIQACRQILDKHTDAIEFTSLPLTLRNELKEAMESAADYRVEREGDPDDS